MYHIEHSKLLVLYLAHIRNDKQESPMARKSVLMQWANDILIKYSNSFKIISLFQVKDIVLFESYGLTNQPQDHIADIGEMTLPHM